MKVRLRELECKRCGYKWTPRTDDVRTCPNPNCRSVYWDKERERKIIDDVDCNGACYSDADSGL